MAGYGENVPLVAAAVCPHPPAIFPELAGAAAAELDDLREACVGAIGRLLAAEPELVVVVGTGDRTARYGPADHGSLRPYGLDRWVHLDRINCAGQPGLPLSLMVGGWLLRRAGARCLRHGQSLAPDTPVEECRRIGAELLADPGAAAEHRVGLLVMGDGSACRGERAPGYDDPAARPYDDEVAAALAAADAAALLALDPELSARLRVAGRPAWQVLAAAVARTGVPWRGRLDYHAAPYGVAYFVASWAPVRSGPNAPTPGGGTAS